MLIRARSYLYLVRTGKSTSMQMKVHLNVHCKILFFKGGGGGGRKWG